MKDNNFEAKIQAAVEMFRQGYKDRDINKVDEFIDELFEESEKTAVLGTSFGEWMLGKAGAREIVESDWKYWGDVDVDTTNIEFSIFGDVAAVNLKGTVRYEFEYTEAKFDSYLNFVKHFFDPKDQDFRMSAKAKAGHIGFVLTHFNQNRKEGKREYFYPLRINSIMTMQGDRAVFRFMKFSMDTCGQYPELRIDGQMMSMDEYYEQQQGFAMEYAKENRPEAKAAVEEFVKFIKDGFNGDKEKVDCSSFFSMRDDNCIIDAKGRISKGNDVLEAVQDLRQTLNRLAVDDKAIFSDVKEDTAWIACNALASRSISEQEGSETLMRNIQSIANLDAASKDKLFAVQKLVSEYFLQHSKGEYFLWPLRIAATLIRENGQWRLHEMSLSYPFYYILEGKFDAASMV